VRDVGLLLRLVAALANESKLILVLQTSDELSANVCFRFVT
jgi:hypothetical protein